MNRDAHDGRIGDPPDLHVIDGQVGSGYFPLEELRHACAQIREGELDVDRDVDATHSRRSQSERGQCALLGARTIPDRGVRSRRDDKRRGDGVTAAERSRQCDTLRCHAEPRRPRGVEGQRLQHRAPQRISGRAQIGERWQRAIQLLPEPLGLSINDMAHQWCGVEPQQSDLTWIE